jgi:hypothetical protein
MRVTVTRQGGLAGIPCRGSVETSDLPPEVARAVASLLCSRTGEARGPVHPDGFAFEVSADGHHITYNEPDIPEPLRPVIEAALAHGTFG